MSSNRKLTLIIILGFVIGISLPVPSCEGADATYYHPKFIGRPMANGDLFDTMAWTCAYGNIHVRPFQYPLGKILMVKYGDTKILVTVTDRHGGKTDVDLSFWAFTSLLPAWNGEGRLDVEVEALK